MDDPSYKRLLTHQRIVKDLFIGFIAPRRPSGWAGAFDLDTLREVPTENVTDELRRRLGDVVWSIDRRDGRGGARLGLRYEVLDLVAVRRDDLPRTNLLRWVAEVEQSVQAGTLPERVRELGEWLAEAGEPGLTRTFDLWLGALGRKWGVELPSIREYEEASAVLAEKIDRWGAEILEQGVEQGVKQGNERQKALLRRQAARRFGAAAAGRLSAVLAEVTDADRLAEAGEWIVDCATTAEFLARVDRSG